MPDREPQTAGRIEISPGDLLRRQLADESASPAPQRLLTTFYSFKGGVGRTQALSAVAHILARRWRTVLMVDVDLEAPGLSLSLLDRNARETHEGFTEIVSDLAAQILNVAAEGVDIDYDLVTQTTERISGALHRIAVEGGSDEPELIRQIRERFPQISLPPRRSGLYLLSCGRIFDDYPTTVGQLPLDELIAFGIDALAEDRRDMLYKAARIPAGHTLANLLQVLVHVLHHGLMECTVAEGIRPDYVFVDSRAGLADIGGLCVRGLADHLVALSGLNKQNIEGTRMVLERLDEGQRSPDRLTVVISPVPDAEVHLLQDRLTDAKRALGLSSTPPLLHYHPRLALLEEAFSQPVHQHSQLCQDYDQLADHLRGISNDNWGNWLAAANREVLRLLSGGASNEAVHSFVEAALGSADSTVRALEQGCTTLSSVPRSTQAPDLFRLWAARAPDNSVAWFALGGELYGAAVAAAGSGHPEQADALYKECGKAYEEAVRLKPDLHEALYNWGLSLSEQAKTKSGAEADALFASACEKYAAALEVKSDAYEALGNWGNSLIARARTKSGAEADALFAEAYEKYDAVLAIKPDDHDALYNWGNALFAQAETKSMAAADALFAGACEKYAAALEIKPNKYEALGNWGNTLLAQARAKGGAEADELFAGACEKYAAVLRIKPDDNQALFNWGLALSAQAKTNSGAEADALFTSAGEKYAAALQIKPDSHEALNNWGLALYDQAKIKSGSEVDALLASAGEKYAAALEIKPDSHEALNNWGNALYEQAKTKSGAEVDALFADAGKKYAAALQIKPNFHAAQNNWGNALYEQAKRKSGAEADTLFAGAGEKYAAALQIKPDDHDALNNWGVALSDQAKTKSGAEADALFASAVEKYAAALQIKPNSHQVLWNMAYAYSLRGQPEQALEWLQKAVAAKPELAAMARDDSDFDTLRDDPRFRELVGTGE